MLVEIIESIVNKGFDEYIDLVVKGRFYEYLGQEFSDKIGLHYEERKAVKQAVFQIFFTDNRFIGLEDAKPK